jgi:hypothetical protein
MINLKYTLGGLDINPAKFVLSEVEEKFRLEGLKKIGKNYRPISKHIFVVGKEENVASIYVSSEGCRHSHVARKFNLLDEKLIGGGNCYMLRRGELVLDDFSGDYLAIPKSVAQAFAELIKPEVTKMGLEVVGIIANPNESKLHSFWKEQ